MTMDTFFRIFSNKTAVIAVFAGAVLTFAFAGQVSAQKTKPGAKEIKPATVAKPAAPAAAQPPASSDKCKAASGLTTEEVNEIVAIHTVGRSTYGAAALKWDCTLASYAQEWANKSVFAHRDDTPYGESIFVGSNGDETIRSAMDRWLAEKAFWTNSTGTCAAGKTCTHFTQMVWKKT